ncbi:hypothetical protein [Streptomyces rubradiris]|uniref:hypothetical protein n=1 Tax=Streptomyces rubradiris TaxID=285531 RepID=UPI001679D49E|nr:hypothetical protein [Streptomyces rubradiris]
MGRHHASGKLLRVLPAQRAALRHQRCQLGSGGSYVDGPALAHAPAVRQITERTTAFAGKSTGDGERQSG